VRALGTAGGAAYKGTPSSDSARCCNAVGRVIFSNGSAPGRFGWMRFFVIVARSASGAWKL